ncbi:MAG TPA: PIN domain-containing protein [Tepidisphaeraceae bacterium]|nr:PIN domain-containing protein [Tepidisphaeraceae bacterium]
MFILVIFGVGMFFLQQTGFRLGIEGEWNWLIPAATLVVGVIVVCIDILAPRKKLAVFSGTFLGLVVGLVLAYALSFVVQLLVDQYLPRGLMQHREVLTQFFNLVIGVTACYLSISFIMQTKDDFRFIIPFVEFSKQTKGARPILLDTSVLIDGRIGDICATGILESQLIVPRFVLLELHQVADSGDKLKRNRGRRGLDVLAKLQGSSRVSVVLYDSSVREEEKDAPVDTRLLNLAKDLNARVLTNDFNLNKVAQLRGVDVININDLANALKPVVLPGEKMILRLVKPGEEAGQGVGYLEDGTMVVVEQGRQHVNEEVEITVTSALQTSAGKMIFGRLNEGYTSGGGGSASSRPQPRSRGRGEAAANPGPAAR